MGRLLRLLSVLHARGFHPAVLAGLVIMPAVVAVGCLTDRLDQPGLGPDMLRGSLDDLAIRGTLPGPRF